MDLRVNGMLTFVSLCFVARGSLSSQDKGSLSVLVAASISSIVLNTNLAQLLARTK